MSFSRYGSKVVFQNFAEELEEILEERGVNHITQFYTPRLRHPTRRGKSGLNRIGHVWKIGDRYWKLAQEHYGDGKLWWVIAWYNKKPTEAHVKIGDTIVIPMPLDQVLRQLGV